MTFALDYFLSQRPPSQVWADTRGEVLRKGLSQESPKPIDLARMSEQFREYVRRMGKTDDAT